MNYLYHVPYLDEFCQCLVVFYLSVLVALHLRTRRPPIPAHVLKQIAPKSSSSVSDRRSSRPAGPPGPPATATMAPTATTATTATTVTTAPTATTATTATATPPRKLFKPAPKTRLPTPVKPSSTNTSNNTNTNSNSRDPSSLASTVRDRSSPTPPPISRNSTPLFLRRLSSVSVPSPAQLDYGNSGNQENKSLAAPPVTTRRTASWFTSPTATPVFVRRKTTSPGANNTPANVPAPSSGNGRKSPSDASDHSSLRGSETGSVFEDNENKTSNEDKEPVIEGVECDLSTLAEEKSALTPTQIFQARARRFQQQQLQQQQKAPQESQEPPSPKEQFELREREKSPSPGERKPVVEEVPSPEDKSVTKENLGAEERPSADDKPGTEGQSVLEDQPVAEDQSAENPTSLAETSDPEHKSVAADKPVLDDKSIAEGKPVTEDDSVIGNKPPVEDEAVVEDKPGAEDKSVVGDNSVPDHKPATEDQLVTEDRPDTAPQFVAEDQSPERDQSGTEAKPLTEDDSVVEAKPVSEDKQGVEDKSLAEDESVVEDKPVAKHELHTTDQEDEAKPQNVEAHAATTDLLKEDDGHDQGVPQIVGESPNATVQQEPEVQQNPDHPQEPVDEEKPSEEDKSATEERIADSQRPIDEEKPSIPQEQAEQDQPANLQKPAEEQTIANQRELAEEQKSVTERTPADQRSFVSKRSIDESPEARESPEADDNELSPSTPAAILDPNTEVFASRAFGSLSSRTSLIADNFNSPTELIEFFSAHGQTEMSDFVSALEGSEGSADRRHGNQQKEQPVGEGSQPEQTGPAPKTKPIRRPGIMNPGKQEDGSQFFDNMGRPVRIARSVDIPVQRGEKKHVQHAPLPPKTEQKSDEQSREENKDELDALPQIEDLASPDDLASTEHLRSTDDLEDPPEEYLDPKIHSSQSSATVTPIPRIGAISPIQKPKGGITLQLSDLAEGLEGYEVDDVGNVVNEKGKVLGYVMGDLPSMVGKKISEGGKVYDENGEVLGHVTKNLINGEEDDENDDDDEDDDSNDLTTALKGLRVDHDGNIMDTNGNIVGRLNEPPATGGRKRQQRNEQRQQSTNQANGTDQGTDHHGKKSDGKNPNKGRHPAVPADISLDVKSTYDGIQIIIKIPTMFDKPPKTITIT